MNNRCRGSSPSVNGTCRDSNEPFVFWKEFTKQWLYGKFKRSERGRAAVLLYFKFERRVAQENSLRRGALMQCFQGQCWKSFCCGWSLRGQWPTPCGWVDDFPRHKTNSACRCFSLHSDLWVSMVTIVPFPKPSGSASPLSQTHTHRNLCADVCTCRRLSTRI